MPNRIIKESIRESDSIDLLSQGAEIMFYRLITYADDYGLFKADPRIVNPAIFPLKGYKEKQIVEWLDELGKSGMVAYYRAGDGKVYGIFLSWDKHQQVRNTRAKYPEPNGNLTISISTLLNTVDIKCNQVISLAPVIQSNPIQSESKEVLERFNTFWESYPRHIAKAKALLNFKRINPDDNLLGVMLGKIVIFKETEGWKESNGKYIPHPATWLNQKRWEDEINIPQSIPEVTNTVEDYERESARQAEEKKHGR